MRRSRVGDEPEDRAPEACTVPASSETPLPATVGAARDRVTALLTRFGIPSDRRVVTDALMITSELVTNAIRHGGGLTAFDACIRGGVLRLLVADNSPVHPFTQTGEAPGIRIGGYGWPLVQSLADLVTVTPHGAGKQIAAHLALPYS
ncbi:ATP-binding protein [Streptomyces sp. NPDC087917]|uniref:ATP-binding protein n=1 Tax=Streptomyces sp. NPDC087917 TaxID=3155060 RepID=UPI0034299F94